MTNTESRWVAFLARNRRAVAPAADPVDVIVDVLECVSEDAARARYTAHHGRDGAILSRVEDRTGDGEGWACVTYWAPGFGAYGYAAKVSAAEVEGAGVRLA